MLSTNDHEAWPLLSAQSGVWLSQTLGSDGAHDSISDRIDLFGAVDADAMAEAHRRVEAEAEALRLRFTATPEGPVHHVDGSAATPLRFVDVSAEADPEAAATRWMEADTRAPVDVFGHELCGAALIRLAADHFVLYRRVHHLAVDGWSLAALHRRTAEWYTALVAASADAAEPAGRPFPPYRVLVDAEAAYHRGPRLEQDQLFWSQRLRDLPEPVRLSGRRYQRSGVVLRQRAEIPVDLLARLHATAARLGVGWSELAVALVSAYVLRMAGADELVVGVPVTGRISRAERATPGMTANGMPLCVRLTDGQRLGDFVTRAAGRLRESLLHSRYPTTRMITDLDLTGTGRALWGPIVNVMGSGAELDFAGLDHRLRTLSKPDIEDFSAIFFDLPGGSTELIVDADAGGYSPAELAGHLRRLLFFLEGAATATPDTAVADLPLVEPAERRRLLELGAGPIHDVPDIGVHQMVEEWADRTPEAPALRWQGGTVTYRELDERANRLARLLIGRAVGPGRTVGLAMPRCPELVIAALAVLKTGAAFLSVDTAYPPSRIDFMVTDAEVSVLLVCEETATVAATVTDRLVVDAAGTATACASESADRPTDAERTAPFSPRLPAYLIYTSGSTGTPKAVEVSHRGVVNVTEAMRDRLGPGPGRRTLQFASPSFDAFVGEMTQSIFLGGTLVGAPAQRLAPGADLAGLLREERVNDLVLVPSVLSTMATSDVPADATISIVGEAASAQVIEGFAPVCRLINGYGPTECTISTSMSEPLTPDDATAPPIGTPLRNVRVYVLDQARRLAPRGAVGELYIGGAGVSLGYRNRRELTAERFVPDPFAPPGTGDEARMYRSGDLVRWDAGGRLVFVGRDDGQAKLNGLRIELGEVEAALLGLPGVARAAATVHEDPTGERRLLGYVVPVAGSRPDPADLRRRLATELPGHLVPQLVGVLDDLPLSRSGKLDRRALPDLRGGSGLASPPAPRGPVQEAVAAAFCEILQVPSVTLADNFFDLGGHSLSATRLVGRLRSRFGVRLAVREIVQKLTVEAVAEQVAAAVGDDWGTEPLVPLRPTGDADPLFCVAPSGTDPWAFLRLATHVPDRPLYGLRAPAADGTDPVTASADLVRAVRPSGPCHFLGVGDGAALARRIAAAVLADHRDPGLLVLVADPGTDNPPEAPEAITVSEEQLGAGPDGVFDPEPLAHLGKLLRSRWEGADASASESR
ncbi:non-ribosomal peptide synthetase [Actinoplanes sp. DH11]|uniref:non-ribosomal peptide synthetase n=1 Tax=Actinoplanes sp. DH11 TaxID=2857011 RepID=UPI001E58E999|nr:non-ribosomal peptide synthetase [Actinoplanes sp. DH11]